MKRYRNLGYILRKKWTLILRNENVIWYFNYKDNKLLIVFEPQLEKK